MELAAHVAQCIQSGDLAAAGDAFTQLAYVGEASHRAIVPDNYLRAGRAYMLAGNFKDGMARFQAGIEFIYNIIGDAPLLEYGKQVVQTLRRDGFEEQSRQVAGWLERALESRGLAENLMAQPVSPLEPGADEWGLRGTQDSP
jgi:hypothetical protein